MPATISSRAIDSDLAALRSLWRDVCDDLRRRKDSIGEAIRGYPTPIPRCDAQFNHLYEQHARLALELDRLSALDGDNLERADYARLIAQFVASAPCTDDPAERELRSRVKAELAASEKRRRPGSA